MILKQILFAPRMMVNLVNNGMEEQAIHKADQLAHNNGYEWRFGISPDSQYLDPLFWQSLGKALGWKHMCSEQNKYCAYSVKHDVECIYHKQWLYHWHRFIDHLASGKDINSFFEELLK
jgi:hypothetical protein